MKKLYLLKILILSSTALSAEAIPETLALSPLEMNLYELAKPTASQKTQTDPRFSRAAMKKLTTNQQLKDFFWNVTVPANKKLLESHPELADYEKVDTSITNIVPQNARTFATTTVSVVNTDTESATLSFLIDPNYKPVMLNLANRFTPGGGVTRGAKAQEEDLCRTTSLYTSLEKAKNEGGYPFDAYEAYYNPHVLSHQNTSLGSYAAISMAGYNARNGIGKDYPGPDQPFLDGMKKKIRVIIDTAIAKGHVDIVLGALGCGAFAKDTKGNTIEHIAPDVAKAFAEVLTEQHPITHTDRLKHFRNVQFAILENPKNTRLGNTFRDALKKAGIPLSNVAIKPQPSPPLEEAVPQLMIDNDSLQQLLNNTINHPFFMTGGFKVIPTNNTRPWLEYNNPWPIAIKSKKETETGNYEMIASVAHKDENGAWYTTEVKIYYADGALTEKAKEWLARKVKR